MSRRSGAARGPPPEENEDANEEPGPSLNVLKKGSAKETKPTAPKPRPIAKARRSGKEKETVPEATSSGDEASPTKTMKAAPKEKTALTPRKTPISGKAAVSNDDEEEKTASKRKGTKAVISSGESEDEGEKDKEEEAASTRSGKRKEKPTTRKATKEKTPDESEGEEPVEDVVVNRRVLKIPPIKRGPKATNREETAEEEDRGEGEEDSEDDSERTVDYKGTNLKSDGFEIPLRDFDMFMECNPNRLSEHARYDDVIQACNDYHECVENGEYNKLPLYFKDFFHMVRTGSDIETSFAEKAAVVRLLIEASKQQLCILPGLLRDARGKRASEALQVECRVECDVFLMIVYLFHKFAIPFERDLDKRTETGRVLFNMDTQVARAQRKKGKDVKVERRVDPDDEIFEEWRLELRFEILNALIRYMCISFTEPGKGDTVTTVHYALRYLWRGAAVDPNFSRTIVNIMNNFLLYKALTRAASRPFLDRIFMFVKAFANQFNMCTYITSELVKTIVNITYFKEKGAASFPFIESLIRVCTSKECGSGDIFMHHFINRLCKPIKITQMTSKTVALMINSLTETLAPSLIRNPRPLVELRKCQFFNVRCAVLNGMTRLLVHKTFHPTKRDGQGRIIMTPLDPRLTILRNRLLDWIGNSLRDRHANVRACAVKCMNQLLHCLHPTQNRFIKHLIRTDIITKMQPRIQETSMSVRRESLKFLTRLISINPYGKDFNEKDNSAMVVELTTNRERLIKLKKELQGNVERSEVETLWDKGRDEIPITMPSHMKKLSDGTFRFPGDEENKAIKASVVALEERLTGNNISLLVGDDFEMQKPYFTVFMTSMLAESWHEAGAALFHAAMNDELEGYSRIKRGDVKSERARRIAMEEMLAKGKEQLIDTLTHLSDLASRHRDPEVQLIHDRKLKSLELKLESVTADIQHLYEKLVMGAQLADCLPDCFTAVQSSEKDDLKAGIEFITKCRQFEIANAEAHIRHLCTLVWKGGEGRWHVIAKAKDMFVSKHRDPRIRDRTTAMNLFNLSRATNELERLSIEKVLVEAIRLERLPPSLYILLWDQTNGEENINFMVDDALLNRQCLLGLQVLNMIARADVRRFRRYIRQLQLIIEKAVRPELATEALVIISKCADERGRLIRLNSKDRYFRIPSTDSLMTAVEAHILGEMGRTESRTWYRTLDAGLNIYFDMCSNTSEMVTRLAARMIWVTMQCSKSMCYYQTRVETLQADPDADKILLQLCEDRLKRLGITWTTLSERLCCLAGELSVRITAYVDSVFVRQFIHLRRQMLTTKPKKIEGETKQLKEWENRSRRHQGVFAWVENKESVEITGIGDDERIRLRAQHIIQNQLLKKNVLLGRLLPIVGYLSGCEGSPPGVRASALRALAKFMLLGNKVSEIGADLVFSSMAAFKTPSLRLNLLISAADLAYRHPNIVDNKERTLRLFRIMQDADEDVRHAGLIVVKHLVLSDQIKVHGFLATALTGLVDKSPSLRAITKEMFKEWSRKEDVQLLVPDFISRLSAGRDAVPLQMFREIMNQFLRPLLVKRSKTGGDFQLTIIRKMIDRLAKCKISQMRRSNPDLPAYFSHCLSLCKLNPTRFRKFENSFDKVIPFCDDPRVYNDVSTLIKSYHSPKSSRGIETVAARDINLGIKSLLSRLEEAHSEKSLENRTESIVDTFMKDVQSAATIAGAKEAKVSELVEKSEARRKKEEEEENARKEEEEAEERRREEEEQRQIEEEKRRLLEREKEKEAEKKRLAQEEERIGNKEITENEEGTSRKGKKKEDEEDMEVEEEEETKTKKGRAGKKEKEADRSSKRTVKKTGEDSVREKNKEESATTPSKPAGRGAKTAKKSEKKKIEITTPRKEPTRRRIDEGQWGTVELSSDDERSPDGPPVIPSKLFKATGAEEGFGEDSFNIREETAFPPKSERSTKSVKEKALVESDKQKKEEEAGESVARSRSPRKSRKDGKDEEKAVEVASPSTSRSPRRPAKVAVQADESKRKRRGDEYEEKGDKKEEKTAPSTSAPRTPRETTKDPKESERPKTTADKKKNVGRKRHASSDEDSGEDAE